MVDDTASRLKEFSEAITAVFESGRYFEGLSGSHTIYALHRREMPNQARTLD